jgi:hypothetical protein
MARFATWLSKSHFFFTPPKIPKPSEIGRRATTSCIKIVEGHLFCLFYLVACTDFSPIEEAKDMFQLNAGLLRAIDCLQQGLLSSYNEMD